MNEGPRFTIKGKSYVGTANTPVLGDSPYALSLFPQLHNGDKVLASVNTLTSCKTRTCLRKKKIPK